MKGWTKDGNSYFLNGPRNKATPQIRTYEKEGRIIAHGVDSRERITVSKDKTQEQIERDIERRLVPKYLAAHAAIIEERNAGLLAEHRRREQVAELAELLGPAGRTSSMSSETIHIYTADFYGAIHVDPKWLRLELSASREIIKKIIGVLTGR